MFRDVSLAYIYDANWHRINRHRVCLAVITTIDLLLTNFWDKTAKIGIFHRISQKILNQFSVLVGIYVGSLNWHLFCGHLMT